MKKLFHLLVFCFYATVSNGQSPKHDIKGAWRCYDSVKDTINKSEGGTYIAFTDTTTLIFSTLGGMFLPLGEETPYTFKNDSLTFSGKKRPTKVRVVFHSTDFISYPDFINKKRIYLLRQKNE